jgi:16S rRNA (adenine1518-N6/adenine1519-N6)-dimethyltransferase
MNYSPKYMSEFLNKKNFNFKKKFGQNFIVDENIIKKMVDNANIDKDTLVIEIGPGAGSLTYFLAEKAKYVLCYEIDNTLEEVLKENLKEYSNVTIKFEDFLKSNIKEDLKNFNYKKLYIVANLPYYITTPIIMKIIDDSIPVDKIQVMVQKEVGDRFKAKPGSKDYNSLSIYLNYYFDVDKVMDISRNVFLPKPNVDSIVVEFTKKDKKLELNNEKIFFKLIKDSFVQKRKTLKNNLKNYDLDKIEEVLKKYNMDLSVRAENVPDYVFAEISNKIGE